MDNQGKRECFDCENNKRKVQEAGQAISSKDVLIEMLQEEIKRVEGLYMRSIDNYEKLRFTHCSTVQDFSNLKEIYRRLDEGNGKLIDKIEHLRAHIKQLQAEIANSRNQCPESEPTILLKENLDKKNELLTLQMQILNQEKTNHMCDSRLEQLEERNCILNDTLEIITKENKSNLKTIEDLNANIKELNQEHEICITQLYKEIFDLEKQLGKSRETIITDDKFKDCSGDLNDHDKYGKRTDSLDKMDCKSVEMLENKIILLETEVKEVTQKSTEYQDEIMFNCKKIENLLEQISILEEKLRFRDSSVDTQHTEDMFKLKEEYETQKSQKDNESSQLKISIEQERRTKCENKELFNKISILEQQLERITKEKCIIDNTNKILSIEVNNFQTEIQKIRQQTEENVGKILKKFDLLENQFNEKQSELNNCWEDISTIKKNIGSIQDKEECLSKIEDLKKQIVFLEVRNAEEKKEREKHLEEIKCLQKQIKNCENDIDELEIDNCRKQCMINHLEDCIDSSNKILSECEEEMNELNVENDRLKKDIEELKSNLDKNILEAEFVKAENCNLEQKTCEVNRQSEQIEVEKRKLYEDFSLLSEKYERLVKENKEKDIELEKIKLKKGKLSDELKRKIAAEKELTEKYEQMIKTNNEKDEELEKIAFRKCRLCDKLNKTASIQQDLSKLLEKYEQLLKDSKDQDTKLEKIRYHCTVALTAEELKKDYRERQLLTEEVQKNKDQSNSMDLTKILQCHQIKVNDETIKSWQAKYNKLYLKTSKLEEVANRASENNRILRDSVNNLVLTLLKELRNFGDRTSDTKSCPAKTILEELLQALSESEKLIKTESCGIFPEKLPRSSTSTISPDCNCMSIIMSNYKIKDESNSKSMCSKEENCKETFSSSDILGIYPIYKPETCVLNSRGFNNICNAKNYSTNMEGEPPGTMEGEPFIRDSHL